MSNNETPIAEGQSDGNLSAEQLIAGLTQAESPINQGGEEQQPDEGQQEEQEPDNSGEGESQEGRQEEGDPESGEEEEIQEEDSIIEQLLAGDPEILKEIGRKAGSRGLSRIGELTGKIKTLEAQLSQVQANAKPLAPAIPQSEIPEPFRKLKTVEEIQAKRKEMQKVAKDVEQILDEHEDYGPDDLIKVGDTEISKKDLKKAKRNALDAIAEYLPAQESEIARLERAKLEEQQWNSAIPAQIPDFADEKSELSQKLDEAKSQPSYAELKATSAGPMVDYLIAHALRSIHQLNTKAKPKAVVPGDKPRPRVSGSPVGTTSRPGPQATKAKEYKEKFDQTGRADDFVKLLAGL